MILVDSNVLLDVVLERHPHVDASATFLDELRNGKQAAYVAWHTVATVYYIAQREVGDSAAREFIRDAVSVLNLAPIRRDSIQIALDLPLSDFEDAMQVAAAEACGAEYIVTRDRNDFNRSPIPAIDPQTALERLF